MINLYGPLFERYFNSLKGYSLRSGAAGWGCWGRGEPEVTYWYFSFRTLIKSSYFKMYKMYCLFCL